MGSPVVLEESSVAPLLEHGCGQGVDACLAHAPEGSSLGVGAPKQDPVVLHFATVAAGPGEEESVKLSEMRPTGG